MATEQQDVETLKRRGRRRLVGAVALVLLAVIVLPMVFDPEPRRPPASISVRIPGENETPFAPKAPERKAPAAPEKKAPPTEKAESSGEQYVVQVGAFANLAGVVAKLDAAKLPYFTEPLGNLTRVRAGPFPSREVAEKALEQLKGLGFEPGAVSPRSG